jgi:DNA-binding transcriptional MocR family regulator
VIPSHLRNVADGNPDPDLLPRLSRLLPTLHSPPRLYGEPTNRKDLLSLASRQFRADGVPADHLAIVGGALDGIERALQAHLRPGDHIAVEDPGYTGVLDLVTALGLLPEPVAVDELGPLPEELRAALSAGAAAFILTPRAQNPTGAALSRGRVQALQAVLEPHPDVLIIEDDHAGAVAGLPALTLCGSRSRFVVVRSVSKSLGPDLRLALLAGDGTSVARIEGRQALGSGWVSHVLQELVARLLSDAKTLALLDAAAAAYAERRKALIEALARRQIPAHGRSGLNVWIPVSEEVKTVTSMAALGWAIRGTEAYRMHSPPAVRATVSRMGPKDAEAFAGDLAAALGDRPVTALA